MGKVNLPIEYCKIGDVLAGDIFDTKGVRLVAKDTVINEFLRKKFLEIGLPNVWVYEPAEFVKEVKSNKDDFTKNYKRAVLSLKLLLTNLASDEPYNLEPEVEEILKIILTGINNIEEAIQCLATIKNVDEYTYFHSINVAFYSMLLAKWNKQSEEKIKEIGIAGLLHDLGKVTIPISILNKPGELTPEEFEIIKKHSLNGYEILTKSISFNHSIKRAVLEHHERMDGTGYPYGLVQDELSLYARIISIADVYDALTQKRAYHSRVTPFEVFKMFKMVGWSIFDVTLLRTFLENIALYYVGLNARLNTGQVGRIVYIPPYDIINPIIQLDNKLIDLSKESYIKLEELVLSPNDEYINIRSYFQEGKML